MFVANEQELIAAFNRGIPVYRPGYNHICKGPSHEYGSQPVLTEEEARAILDSCKQACLDGTFYGKTNRPWQLVNIVEGLDNTKPWAGFEFEMGFNSHADRDLVINYLWDNIPYSALDREGHGQYVLEATFRPQNYSDYVDGTADILKLYKFLEENNIELHLPEKGGGACGTHVNLSTPLLRKCSETQAREVMGAILQAMAGRTDSTTGWETVGGLAAEENFDRSDYVRWFGRSPYGFCNYRSQGHYIEFKLFASTDDVNQFTGQYQRTVNVLIEAVDTLAAAVLNGTSLHWFTSTVLTDMLNAAHNVEEREIAAA